MILNGKGSILCVFIYIYIYLFYFFPLDKTAATAEVVVFAASSLRLVSSIRIQITCILPSRTGWVPVSYLARQTSRTGGLPVLSRLAPPHVQFVNKFKKKGGGEGEGRGKN